MLGNLKKRQSPVNQNPYAQITALSEEVTRSPAAFSGLVVPAPRLISHLQWESMKSRYDVLRFWQRTSLHLLAASVEGELSPTIAAALLDHLPDHLGWSHHRRLPLRDVGTPVFFRTDQAEDGTVLEVQCPGSLWGVHEILLEFYAAAGCEGTERTRALSHGFTAALRKDRGAQPVIHHLLDNSSHPAGERFFIQRARRAASYFGFDNDVRPQHCNFVRAHDFTALLAENFAGERLRRLVEGHSVYDLPPVALFDQKLLLAFPFWDETRAHFGADVRSLFPYTTVLTPNGAELENGERVTIEQFAMRSRRERNYFLKYAGSDVGRNWGSRAVFHLGKASRTACEAQLRAALAGYDAGERWILQRECNSEEETAFITRGGDLATTVAHSKHSLFYGPSGVLGELIMFEDFYKVHGSPETITTVGIPPGETVRE